MRAAGYGLHSRRTRRANGADPLNTTEEMTCREVVNLVTEYLEGALDPVGESRFEEHLAQCALCTAHLGQMRLTIAALGRLGEERLPPGARQDLLAAFRDWKRRGAPGPPG